MFIKNQSKHVQYDKTFVKIHGKDGKEAGQNQKQFHFRRISFLLLLLVLSIKITLSTLTNLTF